MSVVYRSQVIVRLIVYKKDVQYYKLHGDHS